MSRRKPSSKNSSSIHKEEIPEDEQWRLIKQTQLLENTGSSLKPEPLLDLPDEIFNSILLIIPFTFIYLMMDMCVLYIIPLPRLDQR